MSGRPSDAARATPSSQQMASRSFNSLPSGYGCALMVSALKREARSAAAGGLGLRVVDLERGADQVVDEVDLGAGEVLKRHRIDQHGDAVANDGDVVLGLVALDVELVLESRAAAAQHAESQHGARRLGLQDLADLARRAVGHGEVCGHRLGYPWGYPCVILAPVAA